MAEYAEGTGSLGIPHADPNLDNWPDPNTGWPDVNTTRLARNNMKVSSIGDVCVLAVGRRTITTLNSYQKMVKPANGGLSSWNSFVRVYDSQFHVPKYSSLIVGVWDTLTQAGGGNTEIFGLYKTNRGVVCVGRQIADSSGIPIGNDIPTSNVLPWGNSTPENESAIIVYYQANNLINNEDSILTGIPADKTISREFSIFPNPAKDLTTVIFNEDLHGNINLRYQLIDQLGRQIAFGNVANRQIDLSKISNGIYLLQLNENETIYIQKIVVLK